MDSTVNCSSKKLRIWVAASVFIEHVAFKIHCPAVRIAIYKKERHYSTGM
jgi:hypothetical protein